MDDSIEFHLDRRRWRDELNPKRKDTRSEIDIATIDIESRPLTPEECREIVRAYNREFALAHDEYGHATRTREELDSLMDHHLHTRRHMKSDDYDEFSVYKEVLSYPPEISAKDIATELQLDEIQVEVWRRGIESPMLANRLEMAEKERIRHENSLGFESLEHLIDSRRVNRLVEEYSTRSTISVEDLVDLVEKIQCVLDNPENGVYFAELYQRDTPLHEDRYRRLASQIRENRVDIETALNKKLSLNSDGHREMRIGVTDSRLYFWSIDVSPNRWLNVLAREKFYFREKSDIVQLIDETCRHLHIRGGPETAEIYLNDLIRQLSKLDDPAANRTRRYDRTPYLDGETLRLIGDITGRTLDDYRPMLSHMGTKRAARVENLQFPPINEYRMKFVAIVESDGHVDLDEGRLSYYEKNPVRRRIAIDFFSEFGTFVVKEDKKDNIRVMLPRTFGAIAESFGIPRGDKGIHNRGLSEPVIDDEIQFKIHYLAEVVPEDGSVSGISVVINRHHVLHAGSKTETYRNKFGINPLVLQSHIDFVLNHGEEQDATLTYDAGEVVYLLMSKLSKLAKSEKEKESIIAKELICIIDSNPHQLLNDEVDYIMEPLGINMTRYVIGIIFYRKSRRLSVDTDAKTATIRDTIRWLLIAPPNHPDKMMKAIELVEKRLKMAIEVKKKLERDGLRINPVWKQHGL